MRIYLRLRDHIILIKTDHIEAIHNIPEIDLQSGDELTFYYNKQKGCIWFEHNGRVIRGLIYNHDLFRGDIFLRCMMHSQGQALEFVQKEKVDCTIDEDVEQEVK